MDEQLRRVLKDRAASFEMDRSLPAHVFANVRRRLGRRLTGAGVTALVAIVATAALQGREAPPDPAEGTQPAVTTAIRLVAFDDASDPPGQDSQADDAELIGLRTFAECMRGEGFEVPDPVRTDEGWSIIVDPGAELPSGEAWREAAFVNCRSSDVSLSGDLILGGRTPSEIERFATCLGEEGFVLPAPDRGSDGEYVFDLRGIGIDTDSDAWSRAVFVTCAPGPVQP